MNTKKIITTALFAALICVATMIIKVPTPTMGYIHPGDSIVLLAGLILGPIGALAAGIGSGFADLFSGYAVYVVPTFVIKAVTALIASGLFQLFRKGFANGKKPYLSIIIAGSVAELFMVVGYFVFEIFLLGITTGGGLTGAAFAAGAVASLDGVPFNLVQGAFGVVLATILYPLVSKLANESAE